MENNGFGTQDALAYNVLGRGFGGYGYGNGNGINTLGAGNSVLAASAHADGTAVKTAVDCHSNQFMSGLTRVSDQNEETRRILQNDAVRGQISDNAYNQAVLSGQQNVATADRFANLSAQNAQCCCEAKLLSKEEACRTRELVVAENAKTRELVTNLELQRARDNNNISATVGAITNSMTNGFSNVINAINCKCGPCTCQS